MALTNLTGVEQSELALAVVQWLAWCGLLLEDSGSILVRFRYQYFKQRNILKFCYGIGVKQTKDKKLGFELTFLGSRA